MNRRKSMRNTRHKIYTNDPQKSILLEGLSRFHSANLTFSSDLDQDIYMFGLHERPLAYQCIISKNIKSRYKNETKQR